MAVCMRTKHVDADVLRSVCVNAQAINDVPEPQDVSVAAVVSLGPEYRDVPNRDGEPLTEKFAGMGWMGWADTDGLDS